MRKTSTKPSSTAKNGAKDELPPRLSDLLVAGQTKTIATMYISSDYPELGFTKGDDFLMLLFGVCFSFQRLAFQSF